MESHWRNSRPISGRFTPPIHIMPDFEEPDIGGGHTGVYE